MNKGPLFLNSSDPSRSADVLQATFTQLIKRGSGVSEPFNLATLEREYSALTQEFPLFPPIVTPHPDYPSRLSAWEALLVRFNAILPILSTLALTQQVGWLQKLEQLFTDIRSFGHYAPEDRFSYTGRCAQTVTEFIDLKTESGLPENQNFDTMKVFAQAVTSLAQLPRATDLVGCFYAYPEIKGTTPLVGTTLEARLLNLQQVVQQALASVEQMRQIDPESFYRAYDQMLYALAAPAADALRDQASSVFRPKLEAASVAKSVTDLLAVPAADFEATFKSSPLFSQERYYGPLLQRVFGLQQKERITKGLSLLVQNQIISAEEANDCLALEAAPRSLKFREAYLLKLLKLAAETHLVRSQIAAALGAPAAKLLAAL